MITIVVGLAISDQVFQIYAESSYLLGICFECAKMLRRTNILKFFDPAPSQRIPQQQRVVELRNVRLQSHPSHKGLSYGLMLSDFNLNSQFWEYSRRHEFIFIFFYKTSCRAKTLAPDQKVTKVRLRGCLSELYDHG